MSAQERDTVRDDEIDLIELAKVVWSEKWLIAKITSVFMILGLIIAFTSPVEYKTSSILIPEVINDQSKLGGSLGGLASLAGVDLGGLSAGSQGINPALYQSVSRSTPFLISVLNKSFYFSELNDSISLRNYYSDYYKTSLVEKIISVPFNILGWLKGDSESSINIQRTDLIHLNKDELQMLSDLRRRIFVEMDWELNTLRVEVEMQDPLATAQINQYTQDYLTSYVTNYSISKSKEQLKSVLRQFNDRKDEFEMAQLKLATYRDANKFINSAKVRSEEDRLESEYNLAFNIYNQLAQQVEALKLQIEEKTPVFTVLEPVNVPIEKSKPKRLFILIAFMLIGAFLTLSYLSVNYIISQNARQ